MPNWVRHNVTIRGSKEDIARCHEQITNGDSERGFSFNNIIPMPESLNVTCGTISHLAEKWGKASDEEKKKIEAEKELTKEQIAEMQQVLDNIEKYGYPTWYEWSYDNWGTKWDVYDVGYGHYDEEIDIHFDTAWSTPEPVFRKLSEQFPDLVIYVEFADEDLGCNCGTYALFKGEVQEEQLGDYDFACEIWGYNPEDELEEEEYDD